LVLGESREQGGLTSTIEKNIEAARDNRFVDKPGGRCGGMLAHRGTPRGKMKAAGGPRDFAPHRR